MTIATIIYILIFVIFIGVMLPKEAMAKSFRHEYYFWTVEEGATSGWDSVDTNTRVKIKNNTITVTGSAWSLSAIDSGDYATKKKKLANKTRKYKINSKTKYYMLHWTNTTKISKKRAFKEMKAKNYMGFQVYVKNGVVKSVYILNHGA